MTPTPTPTQERLHQERKARLARLGQSDIPPRFMKPQPVAPVRAKMDLKPVPVATREKPDTEPTPVQVRRLRGVDVIERVAKLYGCTSFDLQSRRRDKKTCHTRQLAMYLCREVAGKTFPFIAAALGGRDYTTIIYGCKRIEALMGSDDSFAE